MGKLLHQLSRSFLLFVPLSIAMGALAYAEPPISCTHQVISIEAGEFDSMVALDTLITNSGPTSFSDTSFAISEPFTSSDSASSDLLAGYLPSGESVSMTWDILAPSSEQLSSVLNGGFYTTVSAIDESGETVSFSVMCNGGS